MTARRTSALLAFGLCLAASPRADASPPDVTAHIGVPYYFSFYGRSAPPGDSSVSFLGHLGLDATWHFFDLLHFGASVDGGYVSGEISGVDGYVYSVCGGPVVGVTSERLTGELIVVGLSVAPGVLAYGAVADENLQKHSLTAGATGEASVRVNVGPHLAVGAFGGLGLYGSPLTNGSWFNEPLGRTNVAYVDLGATWRF